jgi:hypothetical protein
MDYSMDNIYIGFYVEVPESLTQRILSRLRTLLALSVAKVEEGHLGTIDFLVL